MVHFDPKVIRLIQSPLINNPDNLACIPNNRCCIIIYI